MLAEEIAYGGNSPLLMRKSLKDQLVKLRRKIEEGREAETDGDSVSFINIC